MTSSGTSNRISSGISSTTGSATSQNAGPENGGGALPRITPRRVKVGLVAGGLGAYWPQFQIGRAHV